MNSLTKIFWVILFILPAQHSLAEDLERPNFIYIMADELGYYEPGFMGGSKIKTPHLDQMAREGMRFSQLLAGSSVCAPTRCTLMTGKHSGHASVRKNGGGTPLREDEVTIANLLKKEGYATGGFGKWGCGGRDSTGVPEKHGFDVFYGYYDQVHAHTYYPPYLIRNSKEVPFPSNRGMSNGEEYSQYSIHQAAKEFIKSNASQPFFAYLPYTPPHGLFDIPDSDPAWAIYKDKSWPEQAKKYAAMVTMLDRQVGEILDLLSELKIDEQTLVIFSGDNGGADYFSSKDLPRGFHGANVHPTTGVEFRGKKGNLYEGGLRIPFVARWPGKILPGGISDHLGYFPDVFPTFAELASIEIPEDIDGISFAPTLLGEKWAGHAQSTHAFLYWEIGDWIAIRKDNWRAVKSPRNANWELYDLSVDPSESKDLSDQNPDKLSLLVQLAKQAHKPAEEGSFQSNLLHERDRRAKFGKQDDPNWSTQLNRSRRAMESMPREGLVPTRDLRIKAATSENLENGKSANKAIDGKPETWWHSSFSNGKAMPPHSLTIDLGQERIISGLVYLCRQDRSRNGAVRTYSLETSVNGEDFAGLLHSEFELSTKPQRVPFPPIKTRYVRVICHTDYSGENFAAISEIGFVLAQ